MRGDRKEILTYIRTNKEDVQKRFGLDLRGVIEFVPGGLNEDEKKLFDELSTK
jgi:hypothetical protein